MKTTALIFSVALVLTGCISIINPPESSYNGVYMQVYHANGGFHYQSTLPTEQGCAFISANLNKFGGHHSNSFCTKQPNSKVDYTATVKQDDGDSFAMPVQFVGFDACGKFIAEGVKSGGMKVVEYCNPIKK